MTFLIQTDFVFYYAAVAVASPKKESNCLYGVQTFLTTNNLSANAEILSPWAPGPLGPWALLHHGEGVGRGIFQLFTKFKHFNGVRKCISVHKSSPLSLIQSQLNQLHNLVSINTEFHVNPPCMPYHQGKSSLHFVQHFYTFMTSSLWVWCMFVHLAFLELIIQNTWQYINIWSSSQKFSAACCYFLTLKLEHLPHYPVLKNMYLFDNIYCSYYLLFLRHFMVFPNTKCTTLYFKTHKVF